MKKLILTTTLALIVLVANAQLKVYSGGKISIGSTSTTPTYLVDLVAGTNFDVNTSSTNGYRINGGYVLWHNNKAGCIYIGGASNSSSTGINNLFAGVESAKVNSSGNRNNFLGTYSGYDNTSGSYNTFDGYNTGSNNIDGHYNTYIGYNAGYYSTTGDENTYLGNQAGYNSTSSLNTYLGAGAGYTNTSGSSNTAVGTLAGDSYATCSNSTFIGYGADASSNYSNATALGYNASVNASNKVRIGNSSVTVIEGQVAFTTSDGRFKFNVTEEVKGLEFIKRLRPVSYQFNTQAFDEFLRQGESQEELNDSLSHVIGLTDFTTSSNIIRTGFIAQEVQEAAADCGFITDIVHVASDEKDNYSLQYGVFVVPLVKAVQEQQAKIEELEARLNECCSAAPKSLNQQPENNLHNNETGRTNATQVVELNYADNIILYQNIPNPFGDETTINYYLPQTVNSAKIVFYNNMGQSIKEVVLENKGNASIILKTSDLASGIYSYCLEVDGKVIETKKMLKNK